jgi:crotonobetainyl-CoA:carnitine CoA-transferase CaiB-like acyl-CoA transferase
MLCMGSEKLWNNFCDIFNFLDGKKYHSNALRLESKVFLTQEIEKIFTSFSTIDLVNILEENNIPSSKIL